MWNRGGAERRKHTRLPVNLPTQIIFRTRHNDIKVIKCTILDISESGMMLQAESQDVDIGQEIRVEVNYKGIMAFSATVTDAPEEAEEESVVRWADEKSGKLGVEFVRLDSAKRQYLRVLMSMLE